MRSAISRLAAVLAAAGALACAAPGGTYLKDSATLPLSAGAPDGKRPTGDPDDTFVCEVERPTGSNIAVRSCRNLSRIAEERRAAQDKIRQLQRPGATCDERHPNCM
jgi:hypothetical protein